jgi:hypothetical protein
MNETARRLSSFKSNCESSQKWIIQYVQNVGRGEEGRGRKCSL